MLPSCEEKDTSTSTNNINNTKNDNNHNSYNELTVTKYQSDSTLEMDSSDEIVEPVSTSVVDSQDEEYYYYYEEIDNNTLNDTIAPSPTPVSTSAENTFSSQSQENIQSNNQDEGDYNSYQESIDDNALTSTSTLSPTSSSTIDESMSNTQNSVDIQGEEYYYYEETIDTDTEKPSSPTPLYGDNNQDEEYYYYYYEQVTSDTDTEEPSGDNNQSGEYYYYYYEETTAEPSPSPSSLSGDNNQSGEYYYYYYEEITDSDTAEPSPSPTLLSGENNQDGEYYYYYYEEITDSDTAEPSPSPAPLSGENNQDEEYYYYYYEDSTDTNTSPSTSPLPSNQELSLTNKYSSDVNTASKGFSCPGYLINHHVEKPEKYEIMFTFMAEINYSIDALNNIADSVLNEFLSSFNMCQAHTLGGTIIRLEKVVNCAPKLDEINECEILKGTLLLVSDEKITAKEQSEAIVSLTKTIDTLPFVSKYLGPSHHPVEISWKSSTGDQVAIAIVSLLSFICLLIFGYKYHINRDLRKRRKVSFAIPIEDELA